jgi:hypothetical protein
MSFTLIPDVKNILIKVNFMWLRGTLIRKMTASNICNLAAVRRMAIGVAVRIAGGGVQASPHLVASSELYSLNGTKLFESGPVHVPPIPPDGVVHVAALAQLGSILHGARVHGQTGQPLQHQHAEQHRQQPQQPQPQPRSGANRTHAAAATAADTRGGQGTTLLRLTLADADSGAVVSTNTYWIGAVDDLFDMGDGCDWLGCTNVTFSNMSDLQMLAPVVLESEWTTHYNTPASPRVGEAAAGGGAAGDGTECVTHSGGVGQQPGEVGTATTTVQLRNAGPGLAFFTRIRATKPDGSDVLCVSDSGFQLAC